MITSEHDYQEPVKAVVFVSPGLPSAYQHQHSAFIRKKMPLLTIFFPFSR